MGSSLDSNMRSRNVRGWTERAVVAALVMCVTLFAAGCGSKAKAPAATDAGKSGTSEKAAAGARHETRAAEKTTKTGGKTAEKTGGKAAEKPGGKTAEKSGGKTAEKSSEKPEKPAAKPVAAVSGGGHIQLVDRGCVSFEPHWTTIQVGQSLTWHSQLKKAVTIHVAPGAFERDEYEVPARGTVHTGPAQGAGDYSMWSLPTACQAAPHGVQGAGPGVTVEGR
jgi:hypothetical protein